VKLNVIANGPICIDTKESVSVRCGDASETKSGPIFLCRCGHSANKPFCDGAHRKVKFEGASSELVVG
jgi:CDGSH-type Zn-finger protein